MARELTCVRCGRPAVGEWHTRAGRKSARCETHPITSRGAHLETNEQIARKAARLVADADETLAELREHGGITGANWGPEHLGGES
jgi:hypothetical protein